MARRHSNPQDFELVGMDNDPTPGDPDLIQGVITRYRDVGEAAEKAFNVLKRDGDISRGRGAAMDALTEVIGDDLPDKLRRTATSYQDAAQAYVDYIPRLQEAQETFDRAVDQATAAAPQANQTPVTLPESPTDQERAAATQRQDDIQAGQDALNAARSLAQQARQMRESAQARCAEVLERAASEAIPERSIFEKINDFFADFPFVKILLGILIAVTAIFFPVAGALLGGALFALEQVTAIATGNFSLGDFAVGLIGLVPGGALLKGASGAATKVFPKITQNAGGSIKGIKSTFDDTKTVGAPLSGSAGGIAKQAGEEFAASAAGEAATQVLNGEGLNVGAILGAGALGGLTGGLAGRGRGNPPPIPTKASGPTRSNPGGNAPSTSTAPNPVGAAPSTSSTTNQGGNTASTSSTTNQGGNTVVGTLNNLNTPVNQSNTGVDLTRHEGIVGGGGGAGHTLGKHVGKSQAALDQRFIFGPANKNPPKSSSTFPDQITAEKVTGNNIAAHAQDIRNFNQGLPVNTQNATSMGNRLVIKSPMAASDGTIRVNNGTRKVPGPIVTATPSVARTVLVRNPQPGGGFRILTSYPEQ
ncbi:RNase A-like domain-containing protein [Streptomyces chartreusis]